MGDMSEFFSRSEFACSCGCGFEAVDKELLEILGKIRNHFGPVIMHCACRCKKKNDEVGSKDTSQHIKGMAADFHIPNVEPEQIAYYADGLMPDKGGVGIYEWGCHVDVRRNKARWNNKE
jgi:uncharacterized protein YcbK (DUF882 family)